MKTIMCFYQVFGKVKVNGWGDCSICITNKENEQCKGYFPLTIYTFRAIGGQNEKDAITFIDHVSAR